MRAIQRASNYVLALRYATYRQQEAIEELERRDLLIRRVIDTPSSWRQTSLIKLATMYAFHYAEVQSNIDPQDLMAEFHRRDAVLESMGIPPVEIPPAGQTDKPQTKEKQFIFKFAESCKSTNNSVKGGFDPETLNSWNEAYEAGYEAGFKAGQKSEEIVECVGWSEI